MTFAYNKLYLFTAQKVLGSMLDYAVNDLHYTLKDFYKKFLDSQYSLLFAHGSPLVTVGCSGIELAWKVLDNDDYEVDDRFYREGKSVEYWCGWALAYFQWYSNLSFQDIEELIPISEIELMYHPYHEMDITQFVDAMEEFYNDRKKQTNLQIQRKQMGLTQKRLAHLSDVPLRTIQQYEQRMKNINNAKAETVCNLATVLHCEPSKLLEIN